MLNAFKGLGLVAQLVITAVLMGGIIAGGFYLFPDIQAQNQEIQKRQQKLTGLEAEIQKGRNLEQRLPELEREIANKEAQLNELKTIIPPLRSDSDLIQKFEQLAKRSRLDIVKIQPQNLRRKEFYDEYPLVLDLRGTYHDLGKFFARMAGLPRIFNVSGVKVRQQLRPTSSISANFTAVTFIYREDAGPAPGAKAKAKKPPPKKKTEDSGLE